MPGCAYYSSSRMMRRWPEANHGATDHHNKVNTSARLPDGFQNRKTRIKFRFFVFIFIVGLGNRWTNQHIAILRWQSVLHKIPVGSCCGSSLSW